MKIKVLKTQAIRRLLIVFLFIKAPLNLISQELFFENQNRETAYSEYLEIRNDPDKSKYLKMLENSPFQFSYEMVFGRVGKILVNFYFNENGNLLSKDWLDYRPSREETRQNYEDLKLSYYSLDKNPKHVGEYTKNGVQIYQTESYQVLFRDEPAEVKLGYRYSNTGNFVAQIYTPVEKTHSNTVKTNFGFIDLASEEIIYDLDKYVLLWRMMVDAPIMFFSSDIAQELVEDHIKINQGKIKKGRWNLNSNVRHRLKKFQANHAEKCKWEINGEIENDKDEWSENQIVCGEDFIPFEYKVEYGDLEGNTLALAIGNIFDNEEIRIIIDPLKFKNASPEKRAFIIFHELFHTLKIEHGECGPLMFPYADQEVTWRDWEKGTVDALRCFYQKVAYKYDRPIE